VFGPEQVGFAGLVQAVDLDGDLDADLPAAGGALGWYENLGLGTFAVVASIPSPAAAVDWASAADFDGDGDGDVATADWFGGVAWHENLGLGLWSAAQTLTTETSARQLSTTDMDGDGDADIVAFLSARIEYWSNLGGSFGLPITSDAAQYGLAMQVADLDLDGDGDVVTGSDYTAVAWNEQVAGGQLEMRGAIGASFLYAPAVATADIDGDGDLDVLASSSTFDNFYIDANGIIIYEGWNGRLLWWRNTLTDVDGDDLMEATEECITGTDPAQADTDGGGVSDGEELAGLTDPFDPTDD
jgi:hypothetical protein